MSSSRPGHCLQALIELVHLSITGCHNNPCSPSREHTSLLQHHGHLRPLCEAPRLFNAVTVLTALLHGATSKLFYVDFPSPLITINTHLVWRQLNHTWRSHYERYYDVIITSLRIRGTQISGGNSTRLLSDVERQNAESLFAMTCFYTSILS